MLVVIVIAWLAIGLRAAVPFTEAKRILGSNPTGPDVHRALGKLHDSRSLNPDTQPRVLAGQALVLRGHSREAAATMRPVVAREPDNADAWAVLVAAYRRYDPPRAAAAARRLTALRPPVGD